MGKKLELKGKRFGRLIVLEEHHSNKHKKVFWLCQCDCGNIKPISGSALVNSHTRSCGCLVSEVSANTMRKMPRNGKHNPMFGKAGGNNKGGVVKLGIPLYDTYAHQLTQFNFEEVRIYMLLLNGTVYKTLQVRCHNSSCKKWFRPTIIEINRRLVAFNGKVGVSHNFYCSGVCKSTCSTYRTVKRSRNESPDKQEKPYTDEEYQLYRKVVLERENYICEYCGKPSTCVHHEKPKKTDPMLTLDPDYGHACCEECHYKYGHKTGTECSTGNLARKIC